MFHRIAKTVEHYEHIAYSHAYGVIIWALKRWPKRGGRMYGWAIRTEHKWLRKHLMRAAAAYDFDLYRKSLRGWEGSFAYPEEDR